MSQSINKNSLPVLPQVNINMPCHADWGSMAGDEQKRFCGSCQKHVHDLSKMDAKSASELLTKRGGNVCVRIRRNADGSVVTKDNDLSRRGWLSKFGTTSAGLMAMLLFGGCENPFATMGEPLQTDLPGQPSVEMGEACPEYLPTQPTVELGEVEMGDVGPGENDEQPTVRMGRAHISNDTGENAAAESSDDLTDQSR